MRWLTVLLLLAPLASAQVPESEWTLALDAPTPASVRPDTQTALDWTATVTGSGMICAQDTEAILTWTVDDAKDGAGALLEVPANATVAIPQGAYVTSPFTVDVPVTTNLLISRFAEQGGNVSFTATANLDLTATGCVPEGPAPSASTTFNVAIEVVPEGEALFHPSHEEHADAVDAYIAAGDSFAHTFEEPVEIAYHDHLDPSRKGSVHVEEGGNLSAEIIIDASGYVPTTIRVAPGGTVTWRNTDDRTHTVSFDELHGGEETELGHDEHEDGMQTEAPSKDSPGLGPVALLVVVAVLAVLRRR